MNFLRRLFSGGAEQPPTQGPRRQRSGLTPAHLVVPAQLEVGWPLIPEQRKVRTIGTAERNELPYESTDCPTCRVLVASPPKGRKKCTSCGVYMYVRVIDFDRRRLVTEEQATEIDKSDAVRQATEYDEAERAWYRALASLGIALAEPPEDGGVELDVVGESHYHPQLAALMAALQPNPEMTEAWTAARLVRDPQNGYDRNAVKVVIHGLHVGHLSREDAVDIGPWLRKVDRLSEPTYVLARLGGGRVANGEVGPIGVSLVDLPDDVLG